MTAHYRSGLVALFLVSMWLFLVVWAAVPSLLMGWESVAITGESMSPSIHRGDVVVAVPPGDTVVGPGSVVVSMTRPARER